MKILLGFVVLGFVLVGCGAEEAATPEDSFVGEIDVVVKTYCDCMFLGCHDYYHSVWGEDEVAAREGCFEEARLIPRSPGASSGHFLECRLEQCMVALDERDESLCPLAQTRQVCQ